LYNRLDKLYAGIIIEGERGCCGMKSCIEPPHTICRYTYSTPLMMLLKTAVTSLLEEGEDKALYDLRISDMRPGIVYGGYKNVRKESVRCFGLREWLQRTTG